MGMHADRRYTRGELEEAARLGAGVGSGAVMALAPDVVMPTEVIEEGLAAALADFDERRGSVRAYSTEQLSGTRSEPAVGPVAERQRALGIEGMGPSAEAIAKRSLLADRVAARKAAPGVDGVIGRVREGEEFPGERARAEAEGWPVADRVDQGEEFPTSPAAMRRRVNQGGGDI